METRLEKILTRSYKKDMLDHIRTYPEDFDELIQLAMSNKEPYSWRAAWLLWSCIRKNDERLLKYVDKMIDLLPSMGDSQQRELLKILYLMEYDEDSEGKLFDLSLSIWEKLGIQPSLRFNALKIIIKITKKHPELKQELSFLLQNEYLESLTPGVKHSINKMIKAFKLKPIAY